MRRRLPDPHLRAQRFLRWYPLEWRVRYGDEFSELLAADLAEQPRSLYRSVDVALGGIMARSAAAGLTGVTVRRAEQPRRSLATFVCSIAIFLAVAASIWSQLNIARKWSEPATPATEIAVVIMTISLFIGITLAAVGAVPIAWQTAVATARRRTPQIRRPALLFMAGIAVLIAGGLRYRNGWDGSGAHPWTHQAIGLGDATAFLWASTLAVSAYWAHPSILLGLPVSEIIWMVLSPVALLAAVIGGAHTVRGLDLSPQLLRFTNCVARMVTMALGLFVLGTLTWLLDGGPGPSNLYQPGTVDQLGVVVMTASLGVAVLSAHRSASSRELRICS